MPATYRDQQNQLWIYLSICWWIGSLAAWVSILISQSSPSANDSTLTFCGMLVFAVSAALRLPILTTKPETSSMEDHFVWLLCVTANVNWIGYLWLSTPNLAATLPAIGLGLLCEAWLWSEAEKSNSIQWLRNKISELTLRTWKVISGAGNSVQPALSFAVAPELTGSAQNANRQSAISVDAVRSTDSVAESNDNHIRCTLLGEPPTELNASTLGEEGSVVSRTSEDGIDPLGRRYLAGEIVIHWQPEQRSQQVVIGFVPAFSGVPEIEIELDSLECSWQIQNCTQVGLRLQIRRSGVCEEPQNSLSWYARAAEHRLESPDSQPQTLA